MRRAVIAFLLLAAFAPLVWAEPARVYEWLQFLPADQERGGYTEDIFALDDGFAVVVNGNLKGRPLFRIAKDGTVGPKILPNDAPAQSFAVSPTRILLANNIYLLNLTSSVSLYTHGYTLVKDIPTPFTDTEAVFAAHENPAPSFVLAGQRMDGSLELWGITEAGSVLWKKNIAKAHTYSNDFGIYWHQGHIVLVLQHRTKGLVVRLYSPQAELVKEFPAPTMGTNVSYTKNTIPALFQGTRMVVAGMADEHTVRMCFIDLAGGASACNDLQRNEGSAEHMRLAALNGGRVAVVLGTLIYITDYEGGAAKAVPNPLPDSFLVCLLALPDGDLLAGGSYQTPSMLTPAPFVARFPESVLQGSTSPLP